MRELLILAMITASAGLLGCAAAGQTSQQPASAASAVPATHTASGKPETFIPGASKKQAVDALSNRLIDSGWNVVDVNDYQAIFETQAKGAAGFTAKIMYGSSGPEPVWRMTAKFLELSDGIRVISNLELVSNPRTGREQRTELNSGKPRRQVQELLDAVRGDAGRVPVPAPSEKTESAR
jgi:hypothetical protein